MKKLVIIILILWSISLNAATDVSGTIGANTTWTTAGDGIYRIVGDVSIAEGVTLTINPGVIVHYADPVRIQVLGTLNAIGTVTDSIKFEHESAGLTHRGIDFDDGDGTLSYCRIQDGWADDDTSYGGQPYSNRGGAVLVRSIDTPNNNVVIEHCLLTNNHAQEGGGFFAIGYNAVIVIRDCVIKNNTATLYGGGISAHHQGPSLIVQNCVISGNSTDPGLNGQGGGMLILANTTVQLINNVFYGNSTGSYPGISVPPTYIGGGGLMYNAELGATTVTVSNCIFWNNTATGDANEIGIYDPLGISTLTVEYCDVEGGFSGGTGNINSDPLFVDASVGDFHLSQGSACIDAGNSTGAYATDADDNPTNQDGDNNGTPGYDMGPYEFLQDVQSSYTSGVPSDYIVDTFEGGSSNTIASVTLNGTVAGSGDIAIDCYTKSFPLNAPAGSKSIHRWYRITDTGNLSASGGMDLRLYYSDDEFGLSRLLSENNVTLWKNENGSWTNKGGIVSVEGNYVTLSGLPGVSDLTGDWAFADMNDSPLPVELVSFKADFDQDKIDIFWRTESELNNLGFEVWKKSEYQVSYSLLSSYMDNQSLVGLGSSSSGREYELIDSDYEPGNTYSYILYSVDINGSKHKFGPILVNTTDGNIAGTFEVSENYPNPFNPSTKFQLRLNSPSNITLEVYNILGEKVDEVFSNNTQPGILNITWRAKDLAGGIYYYRIIADENNRYASTRVLLKSGKMVLVK